MWDLWFNQHLQVILMQVKVGELLFRKINLVTVPSMLWEEKTENCSNNADVIQWEHRWWQWEWRGAAGGITLPELVPFDGEAGEVHVYNRQGLKTIGWICSVRPNILKSWVIHENKGLWFAGKNQIWLQQQTSAKEISYYVLLSMGCVLFSLPQFPFPLPGSGPGE